MNEQNLEAYIQAKIQALKNEKSDIDEKIKAQTIVLQKQKEALQNEIDFYQKTISDYKNGVNPLEVKLSGRRGGRQKK